MNREDIIRMAREAGFTNPQKFTTTDANLQGILSDFWENLKRFAALVAAAEHEACAAVCEELLTIISSGDEHMDGVKDCIVAIRARGDNE